MMSMTGGGTGRHHRTPDGAHADSRHAFAILTCLGEFLKVLLGMRSNLNDRAGFDEGGDLLPAPAVLFESLEEETMFLCGPSARVLNLTPRLVDVGDCVGLGRGLCR